MPHRRRHNIPHAPTSVVIMIPPKCDLTEKKFARLLNTSASPEPLGRNIDDQRFCSSRHRSVCR